MLILLWLACAIGAAWWARQKQRNTIGWLFLGLLTGPLALLIIALLQPITHVDDPDVIRSFNGLSAVVDLRKEGITIRRVGTTGFALHGLKGDKRIPFSSISAVQFKKAGGLTSGYIQFTIVGGNESRGGIWAATSDENTVMFSKDQMADFIELRQLVEQNAGDSRRPMAMAPASASVADELAKLVALRDSGVLNDEEFARQKQILLAG